MMCGEGGRGGVVGGRAEVGGQGRWCWWELRESYLLIGEEDGAGAGGKGEGRGPRGRRKGEGQGVGDRGGEGGGSGTGEGWGVLLNTPIYSSVR